MTSDYHLPCKALNVSPNCPAVVLKTFPAEIPEGSWTHRGSETALLTALRADVCWSDPRPPLSTGCKFKSTLHPLLSRHYEEEGPCTSERPPDNTPPKEREGGREMMMDRVRKTVGMFKKEKEKESDIQTPSYLILIRFTIEMTFG